MLIRSRHLQSWGPPSDVVISYLACQSPAHDLDRSSPVLIKPELAAAFNQQISHEFGASMQYLAIAGYFQQNQLTLLAKLFTEQEVTRQITGLMDMAAGQNDYLAMSFLQWFIDEQLEEVVKMDRLLGVIRRSGEKNRLMVEAYLVHLEKAE